VYGVLLVALTAGVVLAQTAPPRALQAAWATSGEAAPAAPPAVIASSRPGQPALPADARLPLPDDGLRLPPASAATASAAARPPGLMPALPGTTPPASKVQPAVYQTPAEPTEGRPPILPVSAAPEPGEIRPAHQPVEPGPRPGSALSVEVVGPPTVAPGQNLPCQIVVRNAGALVVGGVQVELPVPPGLRVVQTKPEAQRDSDRVVWQLGNVEPNGERRLDFEVQASHPGELHLAPAARFTAAMGLRAAIVRPPFAVTVSGPESATVGEKVVLHIQVGNHTREPVRRVGLRCELSAGLAHPQGQVIEADLGEDLAPGQVRTIQLEVQVRQPGRQDAALVATADGGLTARANACVQVGESALTLQAHGPRQASLGQDLTMLLELSNPGHRPAGPLRVTQMLPQGVEYLSASTGGVFNPILGSVAWNLAELPAGQRQTLTCQLRARQAGDWALASSVQGEGTTTLRATHAVQIEATPLVTLELTPMDDPVTVGGDTTYELRVYNAGPGSARGLRVAVHAPEALLPVSGDGPTRWQIRGQDVYFEPLTELRGKSDATYRLRMRGVRPGQGPFRAEVHAAGLPRPVAQELTSHVKPSPR
jgi:uncharacterized repeat protein (TIGR01451 family)